MKKILLILNKLYGYELKIKEELERQGYIVEFFDFLNPKYKRARQIKNPLMKLFNNLYLRKYKGINLKDKLEGKALINDLKKLEFDIFFKITPMYLPENTMQYLKKRGVICISHHWDSSRKLENCNFELEKKYFNKISSFDKTDVKKYKINYLPNFYIKNYTEAESIKYDIYSLMAKSGDKRDKLIYEIAKNCQKNNIKINFTIYDSEALNEENDIVQTISKPIRFNKMLKEQSKSKVILELCHSLNRGYTFRTFDCIGMKKKLITNNKDIINEDFYNPNNILVIDEDNIDIPKEFIDSPYEELPKEIYEKYSLENWIKQVLEIK